MRCYNAAMFVHDGYFRVDPLGAAIIAGLAFAVAAVLVMRRRRNR
jgi:LPXTG-motif cell wall-anchored protein